MPLRLPVKVHNPRELSARGEAALVVDGAHFQRIVRDGILRAAVSIDIMTADFKAMLVPGGLGTLGTSRRRAPSIVEIFRQRARRGVEIRLLHAGVPSSAALRELSGQIPRGLTIRRCPRLHAKTVVIDCRAMYLGSANLTGAGLGAKNDHRRNFEAGLLLTEPASIARLMDQIDSLWLGRFCPKCQRRDVCPDPLDARDA